MNKGFCFISDGVCSFLNYLIKTSNFDDYYTMDSLDTFSLNNFPIDSVIEVRICPDMWEKVKKISRFRSRSYSWVVRYAIFRMIKRHNPVQHIRYAGNPRFDHNFENYFDFRKINEAAWVRRTGSASKHRHRLCLYGRDELFIRLIAISLGCTMSHLIRMALEKNLDLMVQNLFIPHGLPGVVRRAFWFYLGIKLHHDVEFPPRWTENIQFCFNRYKIFEYF